MPLRRRADTPHLVNRGTAVTKERKKPGPKPKPKATPQEQAKADKKNVGNVSAPANKHNREKGKRAKKILSPGSKDGRPTKLDDEAASKILAYVRAGSYVETAAAAAGINKSTLYAWLKQGAAEIEGPFRNFSNAIEKAMAEADLIDLTHISNAAKTNWQAAAWRLERRNPKHFGRVAEESQRTVRVTVEGDGGKKTTFTMHDIYAKMKQEAND